MHIAGDRNSWRDLPSPWETIPSVSVRASAVYVAGEPDETLPSKLAIRDAQQAFRANLGTLAAGAMSFMTDNGQVTLDDEGLFRLQVRCFDGVCSHKGGWPSWCRGYSPATVGILLLVSHGGARCQTVSPLHGF